MNERRTRWLALYALCLGDLMIVLDTNIVNVALPSIQSDLGFSAEALAWVVNAYLLTFGGFLLLSGRLGDLYGNRRVLLGGVAAFTVSSVACAFAPTAAFLVVGRAVQGLGGAAVSAVALALIMGLFSDPGERAKAMGVFGFVMSGGGAVGVLLGGVLTGLFTWHWIFLVNVPIGLAVWVLVTRLVDDHRPEKSPARLDVAGAGLVTVALMLAVYGVVGGNEAGWTSGRTLGILAGAVALLVAFVVREARVEHPLVPLRLFTLRNVVVSQVVGVLWTGAMFACFFLTALYMQGVLGYDALQVGLAYLPTCAVMAVMSLRVSDRLVMRFGIRPPLVAGLGLVAASLALFAMAPVDGNFVTDLLPGMVLLGLGAGIAFNPVLLAAMGDVEPHEAGLASGVVNTSFMMGGALGLAVLVSLSSWRTGELTSAGSSMAEALTGGYQVAFAVGAVMAAAAAVVGGLLLRPQPMQLPDAPQVGDDTEEELLSAA
jgi:EmrB/QacA subfamily drug resistance transporter